MTGFVHVDAEKILRDAGIVRARDEEGMEYFARMIKDDEGTEMPFPVEDDTALDGYQAALNYNVTLTHLETFLVGGPAPCGGSGCWQPKISRSQMPSLASFYAEGINPRTGNRYVWRDFYGVPIADRTTDNDAAYEYASAYFTLPVNQGDFFTNMPIYMAVAFAGVAAAGLLAPYTVVEGAVVAAEAGAVTASVAEASAWEAAIAESAAIEAAAAETLIPWEAAGAEALAAEETVEFVSAPVSSPVPPPATGISLPSVSSLAKQAAPMLFKALAKPSGPSAPPSFAARVPSAIGFSPYDPRYDSQLTDGADNTMLYVAGAVGLAILAAVSLNAQRKG